ncbi:hypothetical protein A3715_05775 [Oleiphilus sp. HI0009]|uniref:HDOD domain-containing protein n=2 Tax=Oleiphilus TaxID=141450 RepID=UPI0007C2B0A2|nr:MULTISPECIES: HDOD domain-containing protein [unclassified Oleiphilus]KZX82795.1 hypothetical protein A3715_05775 [Oleiphilus sp. HI0009]KZY61446.1 hypothetical protein A3738_13860 [Oleiphilus sp. HI0066]KZY76906.1 hypothetical protein A3739_13780 [Oleiphilus sp. HI0067]
MAIAWLRKMFGVSAVTEPVSNQPVYHLTERQNASEDTHGATNSETTNAKTKRYREYLLELDHAFCQSLFGTEHSYEMPTETQRENAKSYAKQLLSNELNSEKIPRKPSSLPLLLKLLKMEMVNNDTVAQFLIKDPALTSQVLKIANSPFFRLNNQSVESLDEAIRRLGIAGIKRVVSAATMMPVFQASGGNKTLNETVWRWALCSGASIEALSSIRDQDGPSNYLLGLIPELAMLIVNQELDRLEGSLPEEEKILPMQRLKVFKRVAWKICIQIRKEWGMSEEFDQALYDMGDAMRLRKYSIVYDAIILAQYSAVEASAKPPISIEKLSLLTESDEFVNQTVLLSLKSTIEG